MLILRIVAWHVLVEALANAAPLRKMRSHCDELDSLHSASTNDGQESNNKDVECKCTEVQGSVYVAGRLADSSIMGGSLGL